MAGIFDTSDVQVAAQAAPVTAPVRTAAGANTAGIVLTALTGLTSGLGGQLKDLKKAKATSAKNAVLKEFTGAMDSLDQALEAGEDSSSIMSTRRRVNSQFLANHPELAKDFNALQTSLKSTNLGDAADEEEAEQVAFRAVKSDAIAAGFVRPGQTDAQEQKGVEMFQEDKEAQVQLTRARAKAKEARAVRTAQRAEVSLGIAVEGNVRANQDQALQFAQADRTMAVTQLKTDSKNAVNKFVQIRSDNWLAQSQEIASNPDLLPDEKKRLLDIELAKINQFARGLGQEAGGDFVNNSLQGFQEIHRIALEQVSGKFSAEQAAGELTKMKARQQVIMLSDTPGLAQTVAASDLLKNNPGAAAAITAAQAPMLGQMLTPPEDTTSPYPNIMQGDPADRKWAVGLFQQSVKNISTTPDTEAAKQETSNIINNVLTGIQGHSIYAKDPEAFKYVMEIAGSPEFNEAMSLGLVNQETATNVEQIIAGTYSNVVQKTITQTFKGEQAKTVMPEWNGAGVVFKPVAKKDERGLTAVERSKRARSFNTGVGKAAAMRQAQSILTQLIRAGANLQGIKPQAYFEDNKEQLLPLWFKAESGDEE